MVSAAVRTGSNPSVTPATPALPLSRPSLPGDPRGWEARHQSLRHELVERDLVGQPTEPELTQAPESHAVRSRSLRRRSRVTRDENLPAMGGPTDSRRRM